MDAALFHVPLMRPDRSARHVYEWSVRQARDAEDAGLSEMVVGEHATQAWESVPNPELVIAAAALQTERIRLAPMAHLLPYHNPASLAIQVGWLSQILQGRYFMGMGVGAYPNDATLRGLPDMSQNHRMQREALEIMKRIWAREPFMFNGEFFKAGFPAPEDEAVALGAGASSELYDVNEHSVIEGQHLQSDFSPWGGKIDIAVTGISRDSPSMRLAGENGYMPFTVYSGQEVLRSHWRQYEEGAQSAGLTPDRSLHHVMMDVFVAETDREARRWAIDGALGYCWQEYLLPIYKRHGFLQGYLDDAGASESDVDMEFLADHVWVVGSPQTVIEKLGAIFDATGGWGTILVQAQDYSDTPDPWNESLRLLASEVAPHVSLPSPATTIA
jgi:3,6-diketocamphane 1,6-monooxygenase